MENKGLLIVVIVLIAAVGAAGVYYYLTEPGWFEGPAGEDGDDGDDGVDGTNFDSIPYVYYCDTRAEIDRAVTAIGTGKGEIIITAAISLTSEIDLNGGGIYTIKGLGAGSLFPQGDVNAIEISDAVSCLITDLRIDMSDSASNPVYGILVDDANNNPVTIENVQIVGDREANRRGIGIFTDNVIVSGCYIEGMETGIHGSGNDFCSFENNIIKNMTDRGIRINGERNTAVGNVIGYCVVGLDIASWFHNSITGNIIFNFTNFGIWVWGSDSNTITGNSVDHDDSLNSGSHIYGLIMNMGSDYNVVDGNTICDVSTDYGSYVGYGIYVAASNTYNMISHNNILDCETGISLNDGTCIQIDNVVNP